MYFHDNYYFSNLETKTVRNQKYFDAEMKKFAEEQKEKKANETFLKVDLDKAVKELQQYQREGTEFTSRNYIEDLLDELLKKLRRA